MPPSDGRSGASGNVTGPHVHFETRINVSEASYYSGAADDPSPVDAAQTRLRWPMIFRLEPVDASFLDRASRGFDLHHDYDAPPDVVHRSFLGFVGDPPWSPGFLGVDWWTPRGELEARYSTTPQDAVAARPWVIGVGVFVTHGSPGGYPRVLYSQRRAGASHGVGAWAMPGGRLEATDADVIACARRETLEETGLTLADVRVLPGHKLGRRPDGTPYLTVFVHATVDASCNPTLEEDTNGWPVAREMEPEKHHPWRWLTEGDLVELKGEVWDRELALQVSRELSMLGKQKGLAVETIYGGAPIGKVELALSDQQEPAAPLHRFAIFSPSTRFRISRALRIASSSRSLRRGHPSGIGPNPAGSVRDARPCASRRIVAGHPHAA